MPRQLALLPGEFRQQLAGAGGAVGCIVDRLGALAGLTPLRLTASATGLRRGREFMGGSGSLRCRAYRLPHAVIETSSRLAGAHCRALPDIAGHCRV